MSEDVTKVAGPMTNLPGALPIRSILCPIDFSAPSRRALTLAARLARKTGARLAVLYVNDPLLTTAGALAYDQTLLAARTERELRRFAADALKKAGASQVATEYLVTLGQPARQIERAAAKRRSDLIVIGTHGLSGVRKWFFGSTTEGVLRRARVPVLIVPPSESGRAGARWPGTPILAPIALGPGAARDAHAAAAVARQFNAGLLLVHVVPALRLPRWWGAGAFAIDRQQIADARTRLDAVAGKLGGRVTTRVVPGDVVLTTVRMAARGKAGLVVMTLRGDRGLFGHRAGALAYRVVHDARTPVLALPGR